MFLIKKIALINILVTLRRGKPIQTNIGNSRSEHLLLSSFLRIVEKKMACFQRALNDTIFVIKAVFFALYSWNFPLNLYKHFRLKVNRKI